MKYSFIMPYYKRNDLFRNTLESYKQFYSNRHDWEIIVTEDYKNQTNEEEHNKLLNTLKEYVSTIPIGVIARPQEYILNPAPHFNCAATVARGQYLILTNPECQHETDILAGFDKIFEQDSNAYIVSACYDPFFGWKQHTQHENRLLHWCNGISKFNFFRLGGFDVNYINGIAYEDDDFAMKVKKCEFLNIYPQDDLLIKHQTHDFKPNQILWDINHEYFVSKWGINQPRVILKDFNCNYSIIIIYNGDLEIIKKSLESYIPLYSNRSDFDIVIAVPTEQANNNITQLREIIYPFNQYFNIIFLPYIGQNIPIIDYAIHYGNGKNVVLSTDSYLHTEDILKISDTAFTDHENDIITYDNKLIMSRKIPETIAFKDGCSESVFLEFIERVKQSGVKIVIQNPTEEKKMYKIVLFAQIHDEIKKDNLERFIKYTKPIVDDMVFYDDASTDGSYELLLSHTTNVIRGISNDFKNEIQHKQLLLNKTLELNPDFVLWLDADEILSANITKERLQSICQSMIDSNTTGMLFHEYNLWRSKSYVRTDNMYGDGNFVRLWRVIPGLYYQNLPGLHQPQYPTGISPDISAPNDVGIIHYGFSSSKHLAFKYLIYQSNGQNGWALDRLLDENGLITTKLSTYLIPAELYDHNEQPPIAKSWDEMINITESYRDIVFKPTLSIVCLIYKSVNWLKFIQDQVNKYINHPNSEFFFVANDATQEVLDYLKQNNIKHYIHNNSESQKQEWFINNVYRAWNFGATMAKGDHMLFINSDMAFSDNWLDNLFAKLNSNNCVTSRLIESGKMPSGQYGISSDMGTSPSNYQEYNFQNLATGISADEIHDGGLFMPLLIRKNDFINIGGYPEGNISIESDAFVPQIAKEGESCISGDVVLMHKLSLIGIKHQTVFNSIVYHFQRGEMDE